MQEQPSGNQTDNRSQEQPAPDMVPKSAVASLGPEGEGQTLPGRTGSGSGLLSNYLKQGLAFGFAALCIYFAFKGIPLSQVLASMQHVDMKFIGVLVVSTLISHWLRAMRWVIMLAPLSSHKISTFNSFCAVMIGYAVNIPIPRGGEVARIVAISKSEEIAWMGVVPTLLIDRLLDLAMLVLLVGLTLSILPADMRANVGFLVPSGIAMCVAAVIGLVLLPKASRIIESALRLPFIKQRIPEHLDSQLLDLSQKFELGTRSLNNPVNLPIIGLLSVAIWACYFGNLMCALYAFGIEKVVDLSRSLIVFTIASVSVIAPTPGCVGTYHIATSKALSMVSSVNPTDALAFATLLHAVSFVAVPVATAAVCFVLQNLKGKASANP